MRNYFIPTPGVIYYLPSGSAYRCLSADHDKALLQNVATGWTLIAHYPERNEDGTIEWAYSTAGHFEDVREVATA